jgi:simple sugar transport system substrate-binding protein
MRVFTTLAAASIAAVCAFAGPTAAEAKDQYRFVMVSHIGSNDPNMGWLTTSLKTFEQKYPDVKTEYVSTTEYSVQKHVQLLEQVIASKPDGIAVPIVDSQAFKPILDKAIAQGIPVVAFNIPDKTEGDGKIKYLTYVGGDEYLTGLRLGEHAIEAAKAGKLPMPTAVLCANHDPAHQGLKARCKGMADAMAKINVPSEVLFIGADPAQARNTLQAYLSGHKNVNYIFNVASWSAPWSYSVADEMGLHPKIGDKGLTILTVDESPVALEGIKEGKVFETNSQGFWLQGYVPMEWLYWYHKYGYRPQSDILTGPVVIDSSSVAQWESFVRSIFGDKEYDKQAGVW